MNVKTSQVSGRRRLRFDSYADLLAEAELLALSKPLMLGNWTLGQVFLHLANGMHGSIDGLNVAAPAWRRLVARVLHRQRFLAGPIPAGWRLTEGVADALRPDAVADADGLAALREAVRRLSFETERARHPLLGELSLDEWDSHHLRHAELHLSFAVPTRAPVLAPA